ncbi:MAG: proline--tRNA ligase [Thermoflexales bacterium]|nr:proline--tRNA ligase [Thermoflexales bacterium]
MRQSALLCRTLRQAPAEIELPGLQLAARAGMLRPTGAGLHAWLPLGQRALTRLVELARTAAESLGAQAMSLPALHAVGTPAPGQFTLQDRAGRQYTLDDGGQAALLNAIQNDVMSYRQLPLAVYRIAEAYCDEERPHGLLRPRQATLLEVSSLHASLAELDEAYPAWVEALAKVLKQCELEAWSIATLDGHVFSLPHPAGNRAVLACGTCHYRAVSEEARFVKPPANSEVIASPDATPQKIATPGCHTIAELADFLHVSPARTLKTMMYADEGGRLLMAIIRGDLDVSAAKLERAVRHTHLPLGNLQAATDEQIRAAGGVPGYASPLGLSGVTVVADDSVQATTGLISGANEEGYHMGGVDIPRDIAPTVVADIAQARDGDACPDCRGKLEAHSAIELGRGQRLGADPGERLGLTFQAADGQARAWVVGGYELNLSRVVAAVLETHRDEQGLIWPAALAPFDVHLLVLGKEPRDQAEALYEQLRQARVTVLYDDRDESPGVKFTDADLIGLPTRLTVSKRSLEQGGVEVKPRRLAEKRIVALQDVLASIK